MEFSDDVMNSLPFLKCDDFHALFGAKHTYAKPACTTDMGANVSKAVELQGKFDWSRCMCHVLHVSVGQALTPWDEVIAKLSTLATHTRRSCVAWRKFEEIQIERMMPSGDSTCYAEGTPSGAATQYVGQASMSAGVPACHVDSVDEDNIPLNRLA